MPWYDPSYVLDLPEFFAKPPRACTLAEAEEIKAFTDVRYDNPLISIDELLSSRVHMIFGIDVDTATSQGVDPETYVDAAYALLNKRMGLDPCRPPWGG